MKVVDMPIEMLDRQIRLCEREHYKAACLEMQRLAYLKTLKAELNRRELVEKLS